MAITVDIYEDNKNLSTSLRLLINASNDLSVSGAYFDCLNILENTRQNRPDVIIMDLGHPNRDMLEDMLQVARAVKRPIAMFVDKSDHASMEAAIEAGVSAYVVDGFRQDRVRSIMEMAVSRFNAYSRLERELEDARSALAGRDAVDKAKRLLMKTRGVDENAAYTLLRTTAMNQNRKIAEVAESLLMSASLLGGKDGE